MGGTKMEFAYVSNGEVKKQYRCETGASRSQEEVVGELVSGIEKLIDDAVIGIGVGVPGLVDSEAGVVRNVLNIPAWKDVPLRVLLEAKFGIRVFVGNDANCFALGEKYFGKGRLYSNLVALTMGTGVGAGVIIKDLLYVGNCSMAGEFGGIRYLDTDYETYCSGKFFKQQYGIEAAQMAQLAAQKDAKAIEAFARFGQHVASLIETIIYSYGPEAIVLGGSLAKSFRLFEAGMNQVLDKFPHKHVLASTKIEASSNPHIAVLGAAALVPYNAVKQHSSV